MPDTPFTQEIRGREDHPLTVGDLRAAIESVPDDMPVRVDASGSPNLHWYADLLRSIPHTERVRPQAIGFSHTGKMIIYLVDPKTQPLKG
jgi:hypothetical protein